MQTIETVRSVGISRGRTSAVLLQLLAARVHLLLLTVPFPESNEWVERVQGFDVRFWEGAVV
jgi:hypothetical protein